MGLARGGVNLPSYPKLVLVTSRCQSNPVSLLLTSYGLLHLKWALTVHSKAPAISAGLPSTHGVCRRLFACYDRTQAGNIYGLSLAKRLMGNAANRKNRAACPFRVAIAHNYAVPCLAIMWLLARRSSRTVV